MLWNNNNKQHKNFFIWGLAAGVAGSVYIYRMMANRNNPKANQMDNIERDKVNQRGKKKETEELNLDNMNQGNKEELFETFMNATEDELNDKFSEINHDN